MKTMKRIFSFLVLFGFGYFAYKIYQLFKGLIELDKTLPQYLGNVIGEVPVVSITSLFNKITITVKFNKDVIKKNEGLESIVTDYVTDFYPIFRADNVTVKIEEIEENKEESTPKEEK